MVHKYIDQQVSLDVNGVTTSNGDFYENIRFANNRHNSYTTCASSNTCTVYRSPCKLWFIYTFSSPIRLYSEYELLHKVLEVLTETEYQLVCRIREDRDTAIMNIRSDNEYVQLIAREFLKDVN